MTEALLRPLLATDRARPLITHYDDAAGTRVELSVATVANWAAKTANWLTDECDVEPGTEVAVRLPAHWQTAGVLLGAWWCGAHVTDDPAGAAVAFVTPGEADQGTATGADLLAVVSLHPMGAGLSRTPPGGALDYVAESRIYGDDFTATRELPADAPALLGRTAEETLREAKRRAEKLGLRRDSRVLSTMDWSFPEGVLSGLLAVLSAGSSLVQCSNVDITLLPSRRATELTTVDIPEKAIPENVTAGTSPN